jgi:hypothetical protein
MIPRVYLAGPMENLHKELHPKETSMVSWRLEARQLLSRLGATVWDPVEEEINKEDIVECDKEAILLSDVILVNFTQIGLPGCNGKSLLGVGSSMEIMYASIFNIPVVLIDENRSLEELPLWLRYHIDIFATSVEDALNKINVYIINNGTRVVLR